MIGKFINGYQVISKIGEGGMSEVFYAEDSLHRPAALKVLKKDILNYAKICQRFITEAEILNKLYGINGVVKIEDLISLDDEQLVIRMEYLDGKDLYTYVKENGSFCPDEVRQIARQILATLGKAHQNGIVHRDIKPSNLFYTKQRNIKVLDFGISKILFGEDSDATEKETMTKNAIGTVAYMSPEQITLEKTVDQRTDIYSFGLTLFYLLTGLSPTYYEDASLSFLSDTKLVEIIKKATRKNRESRFQSCDEMLLLLDDDNSIMDPEINIRIDDSKSSHQNDKKTGQKLHEECNGFYVNWDRNLSGNLKADIRELLQNMIMIGKKEQSMPTDYGTKEIFAQLPIMSLGDATRHYMEPIVKSYWEESYNTTNYESMYIAPQISIIQQLESWTGLPFRMATNSELRFWHSINEENLEEHRTLCYSHELGLQYRTRHPDNSIGILENVPNHDLFFNKGDIQLVCDGLRPIYENNQFNIPWAQELFDEIWPIGFSLYKIRKENTWNITSPESTFYKYLYLPVYYDTISYIGIWHIPGPGPRSGWDFFGIEAVKGDITYYYSFNNGSFDLMESLSSEQIHEREMWT